MSKGKKFSAAEKHFQGIINSKNKTINQLEIRRNELLNENDSLIKENEELKSKLSYALSALEELNKLHNLSSNDVKELVNKATSMNSICNLLSGYVVKKY